MRKCFPRIILVVFLIASCCLMYTDYLNIPSALGFEINNINWNIWLTILTNTVVVILYFITYETLNRRSAEKESNKKAISEHLMQKNYEQCLWYLKALSDNVVENYIVPKMDFDGGPDENKVVINLRNAPFQNENIIMDLVNDGQVPLQLIQGYFKVKELFSRYVTIRTTFFDVPHLYNPIAEELCQVVKEETETISQ